MKKQIVTEAEIPALLERFKRGEFVSITFVKTDGSRRVALAQFGVANPTNTAAPNGTGESAKAALAAGRVKFFDASVVNADGTRGGYRQAVISRIISMVYGGTRYEVARA